MVFENHYASRQQQQPKRMATSYNIYEELVVPKRNQLTLLQFTKGVADPLLLTGKALIKALDGEKK